ncbi:MAG: hypothetical protein NC413_02565 [Muribaculum sp.]|nr:hypothetical protein [Muribaculum sp.]
MWWNWDKSGVWGFYIMFEVLLLWLALAYRQIWGISGALMLWTGISAVCWITRLIPKVFENLTLISVLISVALAVVWVFGVSQRLADQGVIWEEREPVRLLLETMAVTVLLLPLSAAAMTSCIDIRMTARDMWINFKKLYIPMLVLAFMFYVYIPSESFIGNKKDFEFAYQMFIFRNVAITIFGSMAVVIFMSMMKRNLVDIAGAILFGLVTAMYVQYMFLNGNLRLLDGGSLDWSEYTADIIIGYVVWAALLILPVVLMRRWWRMWEKLRVGIPAALGGVQLLTLCVLLLTATNEIYELNLDYYLSPQEQYTVSGEGNVIMFVMDAVDNAYVKRLLETEPEAFEGLEDFTIYTNTCSVYDYTAASMTQMLTGMDLEIELPGTEWFERAWSSERAEVFYGRLHEAGYTVNGFNLEDTIVDNCEGKFDNYRQYTVDDLQNMTVQKDKMYAKLSELALYRVLPMGLKRMIDSANIEFTGIVKIQEKAYHENEDYMRHLRLTVSEKTNPYFVVEHLDGTHLSLHAIADTKYIFEIVKEYIRQMQELGVYDDATIIVTSDHGEHELFMNKELQMVKAATPIFLIKEKGVRRDKAVLNRAPIYHEDIQATLLDCAGLYDGGEDSGMFGMSIFDIEEDARRERTWYDRQKDDNYPPVSMMGAPTIMTQYNTYYGYTYTGDMETLEEMVKEKRYTQIYHMTDQRG